MREYHDLPRAELMRAANAAMQKYSDQEPEVHFKFTCEKCGTRCTLSKANTLHENGECYKCGHETKIQKGGFMLHLHMHNENGS